MLQNLNYTENPIDIPNPDRGPYRGRLQNIPPKLVTDENSPFGITPEVDHRIPIDENSVLYHGRQVPPVEGDDIVETEFYNGINQADQPYIGGTGVSAIPSIAFMAFDLVNFSSNAFLSARDAFAFMEDGLMVDPTTNLPRTGETAPLTHFALEYIRGLLQKVREGNGVALIKFSYDGNGFNYIEPFKYPHLDLTEGLIIGPEPEGMCTVPGFTNKNWIEYHILQLKPIFAEFEDIIMCVKTGMVGAWGEQHSSPMSQNPKTYKFLLDAYLDAVPPSRSLLTHAGGFLAWYNATYDTQYTFFDIDQMPTPKRNSPEARFGFFNDSYAAGGADKSDNGSLSEGGAMLYPNADDYGYDRTRILTWINKQNNFLQGEGGLTENEYSKMPNAIAEAFALRTTALNMRHGLYTTWSNFLYTRENVEGANVFFDPVYDGKTGLEYFRDRMGYRFVLRASNINTDKNCMNIACKIQNVGFGNVINKKQMSILLQSQNDPTRIYAAVTNIDVRDWYTAENGNTTPTNTTTWRSADLSLDLHKDFYMYGASTSSVSRPTPGTYTVFMKINDPKETTKNKRCIRFANYDIWCEELGGNKIGEVLIS